MNTNYEMFHKLCESRRSCRRFSLDPVPDELIDQILKTAATSPYASGRKTGESRLFAIENCLKNWLLRFVLGLS
jgi:nitroreductase